MLVQTGLERARRRNRTLFVVLGIVLALAGGILAGRYLWPATTKTATETKSGDDRVNSQKSYEVLGTPNGPKEIKNHVPLGYTHDAAGLAAAAVNWSMLTSLPPNLAGEPDVRAVVFSSNAKVSGSDLFPPPADDKPLMRRPIWVSTADVTEKTGTVRLITSSPDVSSNTALVGYREYYAVWEDGDWRIHDTSKIEMLQSGISERVDQYGMSPVYGYFLPLAAED